MLSACLLWGSLLASPVRGGVESFELENGLRGMLRRVPGARYTALVTLLDVGERHDPEGRCGMAHLVEHLLVTASAGSRPSRTAEDWFRSYSPAPLGCNAQTGEDYTLLATVFSGKDLEAELVELRDRMSALHVTPEDLRRELPRLEVELGNMFGGIPDLGARNLARELLRPSGEGARRGGLVEQLQATTVEEVADFWRRYYKPRNARIVIVGDFDPAEVREEVERLFADVPGGEALPGPRPRASVSGAGRQRVVLDAAQGQDRVLVTRAYAVPAPQSEHYPAFLVFLSRLFQQQGKTLQSGQGVQFQCAPVDDPFVMFLSDSCATEEDVPQVLKRMDRRVAEVTTEDGLARDAATVSMGYAWMFGGDVPDMMAMNNPYGAAFGLGRGAALGIRWSEVQEHLGHLTAKEVRAAATAVFGDADPVTVILVPGG